MFRLITLLILVVNIEGVYSSSLVPAPCLPPVIKQGETRLQTAVLNHDIEEVMDLLKKGANMNEKNSSGKTLLHLAMPENVVKVESVSYFQISLKFWQMAIFLLNRGADPTLSDSQGVFPLDLAFDAPDELIFLMIEKGSIPNAVIRDQMNKDPLFKTRVQMAQRVFQKDPKAVKFTLVPYEKYGLSDLHLALIRDDNDSAKKIIEKGGESIQSSSYGVTPFHLSVYQGKIELVKLLIQKGVDINSPTWWQGARGSLEVLRLLCDIVLNPTLDVRQQIRGIAFGVFENRLGYTPLMLAVLKEDLSMVKVFIENGANIHAVDEDKWSALHFAGYKLNVEIFDFLVKNGADPKAVNIFDEKPEDYFSYNTSSRDIKNTY